MAIDPERGRPQAEPNEIRRPTLLRATVLYSIANLINSGIPFLILPILTRYLSPAGYGTLAMFTATLGFLTILVGLGVHGAVNRQYFESSRADFAPYVATCLLIVLGGACVTGFLLWLCAGQLSQLLVLSPSWLTVAWAAAICLVVHQIALAIWQADERVGRYAFMQIGHTAVSFSLTVLLVVTLLLDWQGRIIAQVLALALFAGFALVAISLQGFVLPVVRTSHARHALGYGLPLVPHAIGGLIIASADKVILANVLGLAETGIYTVGAQIGSLVMIANSAVSNAWIPWLYRHLEAKTDAADRAVVRVTYALGAATLAIAVAVMLLAPPILQFIVGRDFGPAATLIPLLALSYAFDGLYRLVAAYFFYHAKTIMLAWITVSLSAFNVVTVYVGARLYGVMGAALATLLTNVLFFIVTFVVARRVRRMPWLGSPRHRTSGR